MESFEQETKQFIEEIKKSSVYQRYLNAKNAAKASPELWGEINAYREERFRLQKDHDGEELFDILDSYEREHEEWKQQKEVSEFLDAELALCRMLQVISMDLIEALEFE